MADPRSGTPVTPILDLDRVSKSYPLRANPWQRLTRQPIPRLRAVVDVSLQVAEGETLGLVGESGCGKTTLGRLLVRLLTPDTGQIRYRGQDLATLGPTERRRVQMVFQNPYSSLNPRMAVGEAVAEPLRLYQIVPGRQVRDELHRLFEQVGLSAQHVGRYPHELSGGQRQRVAIARALSVRPEVLIADEAVASLDVSIRAQVLNLLGELRRELGLTLIFISHDLSVVEHLCQRIGVMYLGRLVEVGPREALFGQAGHPYTRALLSAIPVPDPTVRRASVALQGELPSAVNPPSGCVFRTRCPRAVSICETPPPEIVLSPPHRAVCFFAEAVAGVTATVPAPAAHGGAPSDDHLEFNA